MEYENKDGYLVREIADSYVVVPVGERVIDFKGIMTLNDTGLFIGIVFRKTKPLMS